MTTEAFVYKWTEKSTGKWYIGSRTAKGCHHGDGYICSSTTVKPMILSNPDNWTRQILETGSPSEMLELEIELLVCLDAARSEYSYNLHNGGTNWGNTGIPHSEETRAKISAAKQNISEETRAKISAAKQNISEETRAKMSAVHKGKTISEEQRAKISAAHKGIPKSEETRKKMSDVQKNRLPVTCPHCGKSGGVNTMKRWHFDNCPSLEAVAV